MADYLDVVYDKTTKPYTAYPGKLVAHLFELARMKRGMSLLEPGVGRGEHLRLFKDLGLTVKGLDVSPKSIELSPDLDIDVVKLDEKRWPYPDNTFDVIYSKSFIEHVRETEMYFREALRVLKPGGILLTLTPDWEVNYRTFYDDYTHISPFTEQSLTNIQLASGFIDVNTSTFRQLPIVWKYPVLNMLCALLTPFIPVRTKNSFLRWSRELMLVSISKKAED